MTRIGIATGYDPALDVRAFARTVAEVDERGYEIAFFSETIALIFDSVSAMAAFALASRRVTLGCTQVVRLRSPVTMAQTLASFDELSGGRMVLCPARPLHAQRFGLPPAAPPTARPPLDRGDKRQLINTSVEDEHTTALDAVRWEVATKFLPGKFRSQAAPRLRVGEPWIDPAELLRFEAAFATGGPESLAQAIPTAGTA